MGTPIFAEPQYQTAFDRGVLAAETLLDRITTAGEPVPGEWPGSFTNAAALVEDLVRAHHSRETQRLIKVVAYCGSFVRWRRFTVAVRASGEIRRGAEVLPSRVGNA